MWETSDRKKSEVYSDLRSEPLEFGRKKANIKFAVNLQFPKLIIGE